jgi:Flp pilus assembly protein CpaB
VVSQSKVANPVDGGRANESHCVTLLVDSKQAKALQLAMEQGTLSLALRNPLDVADADRDAFWAASLMGNGVQRGNGQGARPTLAIPAEAPRWEMTIMRGGAVETKSFPMPDSQ